MLKFFSRTKQKITKATNNKTNVTPITTPEVIKTNGDSSKKKKATHKEDNKKSQTTKSYE